MSYGLGVDLGTTFTAAAIGQPRQDAPSAQAWPGAPTDPGSPGHGLAGAAGHGLIAPAGHSLPGRARPLHTEMVSLGTRSIAAPAVVFAERDGRLLSGDMAARRAPRAPDQVAWGFKRRLGDPTPVMLGGAPFSPSALLAASLADTVRTVAQMHGGPPDQVVLTRPAVWGRFRLEEFDEVPRLAGFDALGVAAVTMATEPVAAATHYLATHALAEGDVVAVYDLGGGTFDTALLRVTGREARILGVPEGVEWLGGVDFDEAVLHHVDQELGGAVSALDRHDRESSVGLARLRQECVLAKEALSFDEETAISVFLPTVRAEVPLTRARFEEMITPSIDATVEALHRAMRSAEVGPTDLTAVLLAGGCSRIPLVARKVEAALGRPTVVDAHPKHVVALGAARIAAAAIVQAPLTRAPSAAQAMGTGAPMPQRAGAVAPPTASADPTIQVAAGATGGTDPVGIAATRPRTPAAPPVPGAPGFPGGPASPGGPTSPSGPAAPGGPTRPGGPAGLGSPATSGWPGSPGGPGGAAAPAGLGDGDLSVRQRGLVALAVVIAIIGLILAAIIGVRYGHMH
ncbi:Hsp70 protein [Frankia sp. AiPs1]|uniref:Hsp70 family protein n=1 Tax=Frankia sp. AiPa1 TaxID=573492 RepID=UPI00202AED1A|nr:Hsp70 family protein [Frankia sp. AiPa1]MCL9762494.1 Hsp70 family protein [Frankia sp. AiPa1]